VAIAETARLIASLELHDDLKRGVAGAMGSVDALESRVGQIGAHVSQGLKTAGHNIGVGILEAGRLITLGIKQGLDSLSTLESAVTSVDGAIEQMGLTGKVTGDQIAGWANEIEGATQAAFDDKDITAATAALIRYGHTAPANVRPAMVVMTDLAAKTGDVSSASQLLAKALADPEKAAGKLAKAGVILTAQQQDQIKALQDAGDAAGAQRVLLEALAKVTGGAAAASVGKYGDAQNLLKDTLEDVERALAVGFLPLIEKVSTMLRGKLADQSFLDKVEGFGRGLADALGQALDAAEKLPWGAIGDAMKLAGEGAKAALDLFTGLPPWVQTAVLTGWGLNKLTGGALGGIAGEIGKGIFGGMGGFLSRGSTPANPVFVQGALTGPGGAGAGGGVGGLITGIAGGATLAGAFMLAADQIGRLPELLKGVQDAGRIQTQADLKTAFGEIINGSTLATAFKPLIDAFLSKTGLGAPLGIGPSSRANDQGLRGPGGALPQIAASTKQTAEGQDELKRINQQAANQLGQMVGGIAGLKSGLIAEFVATWGGARDALVAQGVKTSELRRAIAEKLGLTVGELKVLRSSFRSSLADELGITTDELRRLRRSTGFDDQLIADKLGISVDQLRALKDSARTTAAETSKIAGKDWSPTINVPVSVHSTFSVSGRAIAQESERFWNRSRPRVT
jgi:hypothetical protein